LISHQSLFQGVPQELTILTAKTMWALPAIFFFATARVHLLTWEAVAILIVSATFPKQATSVCATAISVVKGTFPKQATSESFSTILALQEFGALLMTDFLS